MLQSSILTEDDILPGIVGLVFAGHETTTTLISNAVCSLLQNPDQWNLLVSNTSLCPAAVEESLRYRSPIHITARTALKDMSLENASVKKGDLITVNLHRANRDPAAFKDPNQFDIRRDPKEVQKHVAFGSGIHMCAGRNLGRLECQIALTELVRRFPNMKLRDEKMDWSGNPAFQSLGSLHVVFK